MKKLIAIGFMGTLTVFLTEPGWAVGNPEHGKALYSICVACHGANGEGRKITNAPRISGQQEWYLALTTVCCSELPILWVAYWVGVVSANRVVAGSNSKLC